MNELKKEKQYLKDVIIRFKELIDEYKIRIDELPSRYREDPYLLEHFLTMYSNKVQLLKKNEDKPYFARIDFKADGEDTASKCYLSKIGTEDKDSNHMTIDWRAPIASVYYDSNVGKTSYETPMETISGDLLLKRQYDIENGELLDFRDVDTVSNDEILKPYLNVNADNRLKNIVASIQSEQNDIIREKINKNLIVQGVAGSGKTTVALHRIAYLVYNYMDDIEPEQYLVIGPNKFFINYISGVLPDLDVPNVKQLTYEELVQTYIQEKFTYISSEGNLIKSITNENKLFFERLKTSMAYKNALDKFMDNYMNYIFGGQDFGINGYKIIDGKIIRDFYEKTKDDFLYKDSHKKKIDRVMLLMVSYIENHQSEILSNLHKQYKEKENSLTLEQKKEEMQKCQKVRNEINKKCRAGIKRYFSKANPKIISLYLDFLNNIEKYIDIKEYDISESLQETIKNVKKKKIEFEDLAALLYLKNKLQEPEEIQKYRHVVIDEAQDFGDFNFYALKQILPKSTFSIFGDLTQSIYQYRGIEDWKSVIDKSFDQNCDMKYLLKSYRTTSEIMNSANDIVEHIGMKKAEPVIRHGDDVKYIETCNNQLDIIVDSINDNLSKNYQSIAIITKTEEDAIKINKQLSKRGVIAENINSKNDEYNGSICTIPSYLSKGLEFDSVIVADASENKYNSKKTIDMKLLYVAMTRALHNLIILHNGELTLPLREEVKVKEKEKNLVKVR